MDRSRLSSVNCAGGVPDDAILETKVVSFCSFQRYFFPLQQRERESERERNGKKLKCCHFQLHISDIQDPRGGGKVGEGEREGRTGKVNELEK